VNDRNDRDYERRNPELPELDILPFMNLMTLLIPFLLVSATFVSLATVGVAAPAIGPTTAPPDELGLVIGITAEGFVVRADEELPGGESSVDVPLLQDPVACRIQLCGSSSPDCFAPESCHDGPGLGELLAEVKRAHPAETDVIIAPDSDIPYQALITAMDASREGRDDDGRRIALFPDVAMSGGVK
jgi:biopolymer transport protein ExbD